MRSGAARIAAAVTAAALGLPAFSTALATATTSFAEDPAQSPPGVEAALFSLLTPRAQTAPIDETEIAREIASLGRDVVPPAIALFLGDREVPEVEFEIDARAVNARARILLAALRLMPRSLVLQEIDAARGGDAEVDRRLALVQVLGALGGEEGLARILEIASKLDPIQCEGSFVQVPIQRGIASVVSDDGRLAIAVAVAVRGSTPALSAILARGLGEAGASQAAAELAQSFGRDPRLDLCLTETLATLSESADGMLPDLVFAELRKLLGVEEVRVVRAAALALGAMGDESSAPRLLLLLEHPDDSVRTSARSALMSLGGIDLPVDRKAWDGWLDREEVWSLGRLPELETLCAEAKPALLPAALAELAAHRLYRHRAAMALLPMLGSDNPDVVKLACSSLPEFRSRSIVPALKALEQDGGPDVRGAAATALQVMGKPAGRPPIPIAPSSP